MKRLYMIGGTMGVGKTACCRQMKAMLHRSVFLDGDWCWDMHPFTVTPETRAMVKDNIVHLLSNFLRCSQIDHVILGWVMHEQPIVDDLLSRLPLEGCEVICVSLVCSPSALAGRIQRDIDAGLREADVLARSLARLPLYDRLHTVKIDTSDMSVQETAQAVIALNP